ncbi:MAG: hypothetical protein UW87_C0004G0035, partial [Candidatus Moranbacteria bacterium GW2011_GWC2_45_10]
MKCPRFFIFLTIKFQTYGISNSMASIRGRHIVAILSLARNYRRKLR